MRHHAGFHRFEYRLGFTAQKSLSLRYIVGVLIDINQTDTRPRATFDLVKQTRPRAIGKYGVFASSKTENFLQQLDGFLNRPSAGIWAKVPVLFFNATSVVGNARIGIWLDALFHFACPRTARARHLQVGVALVVPEQNIELRTQAFDQVVFKQQGLSL